MSGYSEARDALATQLATVSGLPDSDHAAVENVEFDAPIGEAWYDASLAYASETLIELSGIGGQVKKDGTWRLRLHFPVGSGTSAADTLAQSVIDAFPAGLTLLSGATTVHIDSSRRWTGAPGLRDGFYSVPLDIRWHCFTTNTLT